MFTIKKTSLFETPKKAGKNNAFINAGLKKSSQTLSGNGAIKYSTTGNDFVDQFGKLGSYKERRNFKDISSDTQLLWSQNPKLTLCFIFFIRLITRVATLFDGVKTQSVQRGSGLRHEGIMRMIWLHINYPNTFWKNIKIYIAIASWKDIFQMLQYDLEYNGWDNRILNWQHFGNLILSGLENPNTVNLVKKYLPQIQAKRKCVTIQSQANTIIAKWIASLLNLNYKQYRKLKTSGNAHVWQQLISKKLFNNIDFNCVHGRALMLMVSGKFITNNGLEDKYDKWISTQPVAKFTGYVHELMSKVKYNIKPHLKQTINKQFYGLVEIGKKNVNAESTLIVVRDTSGSMGTEARGTKQSCYDIAKSLALYFSEFLTGHFANSWIEFNDKANMHQWKGNTPVDKWLNDHSGFIGSTNFQSVIDLFCNLRRQGINESDFPTGILCISDGEFNPTNLHQTNVDSARQKLTMNGFSKSYVDKFKIILWNLQSDYYGDNTGKKFETHGNVDNVYYFSGYDGSILAFLTGNNQTKSEPKNSDELLNEALNQEIMQYIEI